MRGRDSQGTAVCRLKSTRSNDSMWPQSGGAVIAPVPKPISRWRGQSGYYPVNMTVWDYPRNSLSEELPNILCLLSAHNERPPGISEDKNPPVSTMWVQCKVRWYNIKGRRRNEGSVKINLQANGKKWCWPSLTTVINPFFQKFSPQRCS